jgi:integrase
MRKNRFSSINNLPIHNLTNTDVQKWVNYLSKRLASKSVHDTHGFLISTLDMFAPEIRIKVKLPRKQKSNFYVPSDNDVKRVLEYIQGTDLEIAVLLAAFGPLRRAEICGLTSDDVRENSVIVSKIMVRNEKNEWIIKEPKTDYSYRNVIMPDFVIDKIKDIEGPLIKVTPDTLTEQFGKLFKHINVPKFRFHDLRHYSASIMHAIGIPDQYIMQRGGWSTDGVMKTIYRNTIDDQTKKMNVTINEYFDQISHEISHES